jgi:high-affinity Fe2+/Pb2+ permease
VWFRIMVACWLLVIAAVLVYRASRWIREQLGR